MSTPCQRKMAIGLPIRVIGDTILQKDAKDREELTTNGYGELILMKGQAFCKLAVSVIVK